MTIGKLREKLSVLSVSQEDTQIKFATNEKKELRRLIRLIEDEEKE